MRKLQWLLLLAVVSACDDDDDDDFFEDVDDDGIPDDDDDDITPPPVTVTEWRAAVVKTNPNAWINGEALVRQTVGEQAFTAMLTIRMDVAGAVRPWHVHFGTCATGGAIVGSDQAYPRLTTGTDGAATSTATIRVGLDPAAPYHVNVHESDAAFNTIIACGDLVLQ